MTVLTSSGGLLRQARRRAGLTQTELAARAGVTQSVISAYESDRRQPSLPHLLALIAATGHAVDASLVPTDAAPASTATAPSSVSAPPIAASVSVPSAGTPLLGPVGQRVRRHSEEIKRLAAAYGADHVRVFGSVARGEDDRDSDIDLLIDIPAGMGLFALGRLRCDLEVLLHARVDLVPSDGLKPDVRARVDADLLAL